MRLLILGTVGHESIHEKEANCFYFTVPKLDNLKNQHGENLKLLFTLQKELWQEQEKATKTNKNEINPKQKMQN